MFERNIKANNEITLSIIEIISYVVDKLVDNFNKKMTVKNESEAK